LTGLTKTAKKILSIQKHPECASLFIGNLGFAATEDSLIDLFARHIKPTHDSKVPLDKEKWLHKVRMGTFEDSGKCKGLVDRSTGGPPNFYLLPYLLGTTRWAFVDFTTTEFATLALTNPRNHSLDGRALVVEYASPDAARRSGPGHSRGPNEGLHPNKTPNRASRRPPKDKRIAAKSEKSGTKTTAGDGGDETLAGEEAQKGEQAAPPTFSLHKLRVSPRPIYKAKRAKPGAALAAAPRESGAIMASTGKKIIF